ncbi:hypothetical protein [Streptomyces sp. NPDC001340]
MPALRAGNFRAIDDLDTLSYGQALVTKSLAAYFPDDFLPIYSASHIRHFTDLLGGTGHQAYGNVRSWQANRDLLALVRARPEFDGWHPLEVMRFLYGEFSPKPGRRDIRPDVLVRFEDPQARFLPVDAKYIGCDGTPGRRPAGTRSEVRCGRRELTATRIALCVRSLAVRVGHLSWSRKTAGQQCRSGPPPVTRTALPGGWTKWRSLASY